MIGLCLLFLLCFVSSYIRSLFSSYYLYQNNSIMYMLFCLFLILPFMIPCILKPVCKTSYARLCFLLFCIVMNGGCIWFISVHLREQVGIWCLFLWKVSTNFSYANLFSRFRMNAHSSSSSKGVCCVRLGCSYFHIIIYELR